MTIDTNVKIINLYPNNNHKSLSICLDVQKKLEEKGFIVSYKYSENAILNLCIGGDGAFLRAVHNSKFSTIPFVGINTGHLGFYQEILIPNIDKFIDDFTNQSYFVERLDLIEADINLKMSKDNHIHKSLNEFVIKSTDSSIIHLDVFIDDNHLETFAGDALLISTPSGSTAYNFSAGGSILYHSLDGFQLTPLAAINSKAYRSLLNSIVIPSSSILRIELHDPLEKDKIVILADGMQKFYENLDYINFTISNDYINKLVFDKNWYWINIKDKFL